MKQFVSKPKSMALAGAILLTAPTLAMSQENQQDGELDERIERIVVTATKRQTSLQDTPMSISAISEQVLLDQGVSNFSDMVRSFPGLNTTEDQPGQRRITMRGVQGSGENTVGLYYGECL